MAYLGLVPRPRTSVATLYYRPRPLKIQQDTCAPKLPNASIVISLTIALSLFVISPLIFEHSERKLARVFASVHLPDFLTGNSRPGGKVSLLTGLPTRPPLEIRQLTGFIAGIIKTTKNKRIDAKELAEVIVSESRNANVDPLFVASVILAESSFRPTARSSVGALGLMQIRPRTGQYVSEMYNYEWTGAKDLHDPEYNIRLGIAYLKYLEEMFGGNMNQVLVAYNWGPTNLMGAIKRRSKRIPGSSLHYSSKILKNYQRWRNEFELTFT